MSDAITGPVTGPPNRSRSASDLETVKENRILHTENKQEELQLPFTPRRFQQIKANCLKVQEEIDAQLRLLKPKRPVHLSNAGSGANGAHGSRTGSPLRRRRPRTPKVGTLQDRLRLKIAQCRSQPELLVSNTASKPSLSNSRSVALELERELGKGPLKPQDVSRFCEKRERRLAAQEAAASRPSSATNFVHRNRSGCLDFMARREVQLEMQNLRRCVRTDMAKRKRLADLEAMHQAAAEDYWNRFFKEETMSHRSQGLNDPQHEHPKEELSEEVRVKQALENLGKYMPSKVMKLFTRLFDYEQLCQIFSGDLVEHMAMSCRLYALVRRLIHWSRVWKRHKAADVVRGLMKIPPPLGYRIKMPMQRYWDRLRRFQRTWRKFRWRLKSMTKHIYEKMWFRQENEFLDDVFMFCPGDLQTVVACPEFLGQEPDTYNLPSKDHRKTSAPMLFGRSNPSKRGGMGTEDMMKQLLLDAFSHKKREHQFRPDVAKGIITRELLERLYLHAQRLPVGVSRSKEFRRTRSGITYGFPSAVVLRRKDVDELICSAHQACGVRPTQEEQCDQILPCPAWRVKAAKKLLLCSRTLREGILDRRTAHLAKLAGGDDHDPSANTSDHAEHEDPESEAASSRDGHAVGRKRHAMASPATAQMAQPGPQTEDVGTLTGAMLALQLFQSRHGRRHSEQGDSEDATSESSASSQRPEDVVDAALVYDREALLQRADEELPSQRPSVHLATIEAGWPSAWRLDGSLKAMLED